MRRLDSRAEHTLEVLLVLIILALACVLNSIAHSQAVVLNLFFLPVVLASFFLGCYRAGVVALLSVIAASGVIMCNISRFTAVETPVSIALGVMVWGAVLGLTAILVGTLSDERAQRTREVDEAHLGVIEVLTRYLQAVDPEAQADSREVDRLALGIADRLRLAPHEIDNMRRAALLMNLKNLEITARVVRRATGQPERRDPDSSDTWGDGPSLDSLGSALSGQFPLVLDPRGHTASRNGTVTLGTRILHTVRRYVELQSQQESGAQLSSEEALNVLEHDAADPPHDPAVLFVLKELIRDSFPAPATPADAPPAPPILTMAPAAW